MTPALRAPLVALLLGAGCRAPDAPADPSTAPGAAEASDAPAPVAAPAAPLPPCCAGPSPRAEPREDEAARRAAALVAMREALAAPESVTVEAAVGETVRATLLSGGTTTLVELRADAVDAAPDPGSRGVRFSMRLCDAHGTTTARALRASGRPDGKYEEIPDGAVTGAASGAPFFRLFLPPGGVAWEIVAMAEALEGPRVRFTLRGEFRHCTK